MSRPKIDLTNQTFNRLTVVKFSHMGNHGESMWLCDCDCGNKNIVVSRGNLKNGNVQSCGCLHKERTSESNKKENKYDLTSAEYGVGWTANTNEEFYFDKEDYDKIKDYCWCASITKGVKRLSTRNPKTKKIIRMHILLGYKNYDHIDKNELNNVKSNLRRCTHQQNDFNRGLYKNNTSGITGVYWNKKSNKWVASIMIDGKTKYLGLFIDKKEAIKTRLKAEQIYFKEFSPQKHLFEEYGVKTYE
jgi:hypothetical protein